MSVAVQGVAIVPASPLPRHHPSAASVARLPVAVEDTRPKQLTSRPSQSRRPFPTTSSLHRSSSRTSAPPQPRPTRESFISSARSTGLASICASTRILSRFLRFLSWDDFYKLNCTSRAVRRVFLDPDVKDAVFTHFIPGYAKALRVRDRKIWEDTIKMTYSDLRQLLASLQTPLHRYPMHALSVVSSDVPTWEQSEMTIYLQSLTQVHSRAVLLLQNMVHSTTQPVFPDAAAGLRTTSSSSTNLKELVFPAPLSYFDSTLPSTGSSGKRIPSSSSSSRQSSPSSYKAPRTDSSKEHSRKSSTSSESSVSGLGTPKNKANRSSNRLSSFFGATQRPTPPPQPQQEPSSLKYYSGSWRRSYYTPQAPESVGDLKPPKRKFASSSRYSSNSSLGSSPSPASRQQGSTPPTGSSLHDLDVAAKRNRAPILRVFSPCSTLSDAVIAACEDQLIEAGLWEHMSVGDIVCNFGFVPPMDDSEDGGFGISRRNVPERDHRRWLIFTGDQLAVYHPERAVPISGALSLPSPFYYAHILPSTTNPRFRLTLPPVGTHGAQYALVPHTTTVASQRCNGGQVRVRTYVWLAAIEASALAAALGACGMPVGTGWIGEWTLQGEGTPEGRAALDEALARGQEAESEYEILVEQSGSGKLWFRMITTASQRTDTDLRDPDSPLD